MDVKGLVQRKEVRQDLFFHTLLPCDLLLASLSNTKTLILFSLVENNLASLVCRVSWVYLFLTSFRELLASWAYVVWSLKKFNSSLCIEMYSHLMMVS